MKPLKLFIVVTCLLLWVHDSEAFRRRGQRRRRLDGFRRRKVLRSFQVYFKDQPRHDDDRVYYCRRQLTRQRRRNCQRHLRHRRQHQIRPSRSDYDYLQAPLAPPEVLPEATSTTTEEPLLTYSTSTLVTDAPSTTTSSPSWPSDIGSYFAQMADAFAQKINGYSSTTNGYRVEYNEADIKTEAAPVNQCPHVSTKSYSECRHVRPNCWSDGTYDLDCPNSGLCCFDGCANRCLEEEETISVNQTSYIVSNEGREPSLVLHIYGPPDSTSLVQYGQHPQQSSQRRKDSVASQCPSSISEGYCGDYQRQRDECYIHSDCAGNSFCCFDGCRNKCQEMCRQGRKICRKGEKSQCRESSDCGYAGSSCCFDGCVNVCVLWSPYSSDEY